MNARFLLGPAGSGKTYRCLAEIGQALRSPADGAALVLLAPKQATYQLERQLLTQADLAGYTRLYILSFERLAEFALARLHQARPPMLSDEGRVMVLRALLARRRDELKLFRASARLPGFAQQLSLVLREFHCYQHSPGRLEKLAARFREDHPLRAKLHDLALLQRAYQDWVEGNHLQDADSLLSLAAESLRNHGSRHGEPTGIGSLSPPSDSTEQERDEPLSTPPARHETFRLAGLWLDGFAEMTPQELELLAALVPCCERATLAFCVEQAPKDDLSWLSTWSMVSQTFRRCYQRLAVLPECMVSVEVLERHPAHSRFAGNPVLAHLERALSNPQPLLIPARQCNEALRMVLAPNPEAEAVLAAREILRHVRAGGRYRDCAVLLRRWEGYHDALRRVFSRYEIPFFLDRREPVAHHPLAELTRYALRTVAFGWAHEDWFGALKSGLATADEAELDHLENEALARGWKGETWLSPLKSAKGTQLDERLERLRQRIVPPFVQLAASLAPSPDPRQDSRAPTSAASHEGCAAWQCQPTGRQLAEAIREFWCNLRVEQHLTQWSGPQISGLQFHPSNSLHATVWEQMHRWLENLELAFANESLPLREWLPILEAGLAGLTVGVIPPALDQVLIGVIDRSRNPDLQLALVLGLNDSVFPAAPSTAGLLTEADRQQLAEHGLELAPSRHAQLGRERYYGYIACTRARKRLVLTCAARDANDRLLNPSPFLARVQGLVPGLEMENFSPSRPWWESEHARELAAPLITPGASGLAPHVPPLTTCDLATLMNLPALAPLRQQLLGLAAYAPAESLCPRLAEKLYGATLRTSVLRLEEFAVCPFKFFVSAGLRAQERKYYELDPREQGSFQHEVLARFHRQLQDENKRWRDLTPAEGRARIGRIAAEVASEFREGLLWSSHQTQFAARSLTAKLQDFIETGIGWMAQYEFDPAAVELAFGIGDQAMPAWELELDASHRLAIIGKMDRVDLWVNPDRDEALCVVMDYKGRTHKLDLLMLAHGLQLQLPAYLCVLRHLPNPAPVFGVARLIPAGIFYVNLRGQYAPGETRDEVLSRIQEARARAYQHTGRFDLAALRKLDNRPGAKIGDQFNYRLAKTGTPHQNVRDAMDSSAFADFLAAIENHIARLGRAIFAGVAKIDPYQKGNDRPCALCDYQSVCRIDPWRHAYRVLRKAESEAVLGCAPSPAGRQAGGPQAKSAAA